MVKRRWRRIEGTSTTRNETNLSFSHCQSHILFQSKIVFVSNLLIARLATSLALRSSITKIIMMVLLTLVVFTDACSQKEILKEAEQTQTVIESITQGEGTSETGYYLKAVINGKPWAADEMVIDKDNSSIVQVHGTKGKTFLSFNLYKPAPGKEKQFSATSPANWSDETDMDIYVGESGQATIIKMDAKWIEGTFSFQGKCRGKTAIVSGGTFRIANPKRFSN